MQADAAISFAGLFRNVRRLACSVDSTALSVLGHCWPALTSLELHDVEGDWEQMPLLAERLPGLQHLSCDGFPLADIAPAGQATWLQLRSLHLGKSSSNAYATRGGFLALLNPASSPELQEMTGRYTLDCLGDEVVLASRRDAAQVQALGDKCKLALGVRIVGVEGFARVAHEYLQLCIVARLMWGPEDEGAADIMAFLELLPPSVHDVMLIPSALERVSMSVGVCFTLARALKAKTSVKRVCVIELLLDEGCDMDDICGFVQILSQAGYDVLTLLGVPNSSKFPDMLPLSVEQHDNMLVPEILRSITFQ